MANSDPQVQLYQDIDEESLRSLCRICEEVLDLPQMRPDSDIFESGADSYEAAKIANKLGLLIGIRVPLNVVFEHPSPIELLRYLSSHTRKMPT